MKQILKVSFLAIFMLAILPFTSTRFAENLYAQSTKANPESDFDYNFTDDLTGVILISYKGKSSEVVIPETIQGLPIVDFSNFSVDNYVKRDITLFDISKIKVKYIPNGMLENIGTWSQNGAKIILPEGLETIGSSAFASAKISSINFPSSLKEIKDRAFYASKFTSDLILNEGLKIIGSDVFAIANISSINFPSSLKEIKNGAFSCSEFTSDPILNEELEIIGSFAFYGTNIKSITIPKSVVKIGGDAFSSCDELSEINLPEEINFSLFSYNDYADYENSENPTLYSEIFNGEMITKNLELRKKLNVPIRFEVEAR